jgi:hypothetical protein
MFVASLRRQDSTAMMYRGKYGLANTEPMWWNPTAFGMVLNGTENNRTERWKNEIKSQ